MLETCMLNRIDNTRLSQDTTRDLFREDKTTTKKSLRPAEIDEIHFSICCGNAQILCLRVKHTYATGPLAMLQDRFQNTYFRLGVRDRPRPDEVPVFPPTAEQMLFKMWL